MFRKRAKQQAAETTPANPAVAMLERLYAGEVPDYCLYLRPPAGPRIVKHSPLAVDIEELLIRGFDPLEVLTLDELESSAGHPSLPDEAFLTLANRARVLCLAPVSDSRYLDRLRLLKRSGPIGRCIFVMPEQGTLGSINWPAAWEAARQAGGKFGIELSAYTAGGWLFRLDQDGKAVTFRPIVNPNPEKIARALESICVEM